MLVAVIMAVTGGLAVAAVTGWVAVVVLGTRDEPAAPLDITKLALVVAGGVGGAVALVVAYRRQRDLEQSRFTERFGAAATQLGSPYTAVRIAGVYAMAVVADESTGDRRQQCIDVLCGYLRLPYSPDTGANHQTGTDRKDTSTSGIEIEDHFQYLQNDKVVRQTIIRVIAAHLRGHQNSWSRNNFDFTTAHFEEVDFSGAVFSNTAWFGGAIFSGSTTFANATFLRPTGFTKATFADDVVFTKATFSDTALFDGTTFGRAARFDEATFSKAAGFGQATFSGSAGFVKARFASDAVFDDAIFLGPNRFDEATFSGAARFGKATFSETSRFGKATFLGNAGFGKATFSGAAVFDEATFSGTAWFGAATFTGAVGFGEVTFSDTVRFVGTRFCGAAGFGRARFSGDVGFGKATFSALAWFGDATFFGDTMFDNVRFVDDVDFGGVTFGVPSAADQTFSFRRADFGSGAVSFGQPRRWGPPPPVFDWDSDPSIKPSNVMPTPWPPTPAP